jgi:hypothetical protein
MLVTAGGVFGLASTPAVGFGRFDVQGALLTPAAAIEAAAAVEPGTNLVSLETEPIAARIRELPAVADVTVAVGLPDVLQLRIVERRAVVVWGVGDARYAVDETGLLFADVGEDGSGAVAAIPVVADERAGSTGLAVGTVLDPVVLDAATRIASLTPSQVGSHASALHVAVTDARGFVVSTGHSGWTAVFGSYGRSQRTPALIPGQVQLLGALLAGREDRIETVILADDRDGTYIAKPTPKASAKPSASPRP